MKPLRNLLLLSLLSAGAVTAAHATEYTLLIYETPAELAKRTDATDVGKAYWASWMEYSQAVKSAGILRGGHVEVRSAYPTPEMR
jgi:hypothetical protein